MTIFDSHAHYDDEKFDGVREEILSQVHASGVEYILNASSDIKTSRSSLALAHEYDFIYAAVGIHPHECEDLTDFDSVGCELTEMLKDEKCVALGEIGIDYHYDLEFKDQQIKWFDFQLSLSESLGYPVIIHDREAHGDTCDIIRRHKKSYGIIHSFSGSAEMAKELVKQGWYIAFGGSCTFKGASKILDALRAVPDDRLLVETDCPYLAPTPMRGKLNRSDYIPYTLDVMAQARCDSAEHIAEMTCANAKRLFKIE